MARKRYSKGKRVDMRSGGRVQLAAGTTTKKKKPVMSSSRPVYENPMNDPLFDPARQSRQPNIPLGPSGKPPLSTDPDRRVITPTQPVIPASTPPTHGFPEGVIGIGGTGHKDFIYGPTPIPTQPIFDPARLKPTPQPVVAPTPVTTPVTAPKPTPQPVGTGTYVPDPIRTMPTPTVPPVQPPVGITEDIVQLPGQPTITRRPTTKPYTPVTSQYIPADERTQIGQEQQRTFDPIEPFDDDVWQNIQDMQIKIAESGYNNWNEIIAAQGEPPEGWNINTDDWWWKDTYTSEAETTGDTTTTTTVEDDTKPSWTIYDEDGNLIAPQYGLGTSWVNYKTGEGGRTPEQQQEVRNIVQAAAEGKLPEGATIPTPAQVDQTIAAGTMQMDPTRQAAAQDVLKPGQRIGYDPSTGQAITAQTPAEIQAAKYGAATVDQAATIDPQTGALSAEATADMQNQALTMAAQGVDVNAAQAVAALTERVVGTLDPTTVTNAVKVAGTDLPRVLRAKKQLRRAGLTEEQINLIGNDPELLEDELMDYTEAQRGMIAGLPDEALVSTQMNALLEGMESGEIPAFARPAVAAVNEILAQRGLDASTVGRDALFNAIISAAMPLAQSNATSIKESVFSQRGIEAQAEQMNAQMAQQKALADSEKVFGMNMAQFSADQQRALSNSKFLQTVTLTDASAEQQAAMQTAASMAQLDLATLDSNTKLAAQNAQAFLGMDMQNLNNKQQAEVLNGQMKQQALLSNQAAQNASAQFNATSENQTNQFMSSMAANMNQFNAQQTNAMTTFNKTQENQAKAAEEQAELEVARLDAQLKTQIDQFNSQQEFAREQWNTQNAQVVEQANVAWRRQANTVNTAAINAVNQQNAQNSFGLSTQAMAQLWQEMRDQMDYSFKAWDNDQQRKASLMVAALGNEGASYEGKNWTTNLSGMTTILNNFLGG